MGMETRSTTGVFVVQDNKTIRKSNVSMRLFGSTGEPDGRGDGIWDGGLVVSLFSRSGKSERPPNVIRMGADLTAEPLWLRAGAAIAYG